MALLVLEKSLVVWYRYWLLLPVGYLSFCLTWTQWIIGEDDKSVTPLMASVTSVPCLCPPLSCVLEQRGSQLWTTSTRFVRLGSHVRDTLGERGPLWVCPPSGNPARQQLQFQTLSRKGSRHFLPWFITANWKIPRSESVCVGAVQSGSVTVNMVKKKPLPLFVHCIYSKGHYHSYKKISNHRWRPVTPTSQILPSVSSCNLKIREEMCTW